MMIKHKMLPASIILIPFNQFIPTAIEVNEIAILKGVDAMELDGLRRKASHCPNNAIKASSVLYMPSPQSSKNSFRNMEKLKYELTEFFFLVGGDMIRWPSWPSRFSSCGGRMASFSTTMRSFCIYMDGHEARS
jgi:hypothetical protein